MRQKKNTFDRMSGEIAERAHALAHPARIAILRKLAAEATCICGDIVEVMPLSQSTVSQHLKVLKEAGFVKGEIDGPHSCYCVNHEVVAAFRVQIERLLARLTQGEPAAPCGQTGARRKKTPTTRHHPAQKKRTS